MDVYQLIIVLSSITALLTFVLATGGWAVKKWIQAQFESNVNQLLPKLINDDTSVARYAHQARDAATEARDAALDAKEAASCAKDVAFEVRDMVQDLRHRTETYHIERISPDVSVAMRDVPSCPHSSGS